MFLRTITLVVVIMAILISSIEGQTFTGQVASYYLCSSLWVGGTITYGSYNNDGGDCIGCQTTYCTIGAGSLPDSPVVLVYQSGTQAHQGTSYGYDSSYFDASGGSDTSCGSYSYVTPVDTSEDTKPFFANGSASRRDRKAVTKRGDFIGGRGAAKTISGS